MRPKALVRPTRYVIQATSSIVLKTQKMDVSLSQWVKAQAVRGCAVIVPPIWVPTITILLETHPYAPTKQGVAWEALYPDKATHVALQASP